MQYEDEDYIPKTKVKEEFEINDRLVEKYLDVDKEAKNRYGKHPIKLYKLANIKKALDNDQFRKDHKKYLNRSGRMKKVTNKKRDNLISEIKELKINLKRKDIQKIFKNAVWSHNQHVEYKTMNYQNFYGDKVTLSSIDKQMVHRISVNYLRHECTPYDEYVYQELVRKIGKQDAIHILKNKILDEIASVYPELVEEVERQKERNISPNEGKQMAESILSQIEKEKVLYFREKNIKLKNKQAQ